MEWRSIVDAVDVFRSQEGYRHLHQRDKYPNPPSPPTCAGMNFPRVFPNLPQNDRVIRERTSVIPLLFLP